MERLFLLISMNSKNGYDKRAQFWDDIPLTNKKMGESFVQP